MKFVVRLPQLISAIFDMADALYSEDEMALRQQFLNAYWQVRDETDVAVAALTPNSGLAYLLDLKAGNTVVKMKVQRREDPAGQYLLLVAYDAENPKPWWKDKQ